MKRHRLAVGLLLVAALFAGTTAQAADGFEGVRCGGDVRAALLGKKFDNEPVMQTEKRHAALGLKDMGGDELNDNLGSVAWKICGKEYFTVVGSDSVVRDVLALPAHSHAAPHFTSLGCKINGRPDSDMVVGVMDNSKAVASETPDDLLPATSAWTIDQKTGKMSPLAVTGLKCPRIDIVTSDSE